MVRALIKVDAHINGQEKQVNAKVFDYHVGYYVVINFLEWGNAPLVSLYIWSPEVCQNTD